MSWAVSASVNPDTYTLTTDWRVMRLDVHDYGVFDLGDDFGFWDYYVTDDGEVIVSLRESTLFHEERLDRDLDRYDLDEMLDVINSGTFPEPNGLSADFTGLHEFEVSATFEADTTEELFDKAWSFIARTENVLDPGTFGSPYAFTIREEN